MPTIKRDYLLGEADKHTESTLEGTTNPTFFSNIRRRNPRTIANEKLGLTHEDRKKTHLDHHKIDIKYFRLHPSPDLKSMYSLLEFLYFDLEKTFITSADLVYTPGKHPKYLPKMLRYLEIGEKIRSYNGIYNDETSRELIDIVFSDLRVPTTADKRRFREVIRFNAGQLETPEEFFSMKVRIYKLPIMPDINRVYQDLPLRR